MEDLIVGDYEINENNETKKNLSSYILLLTAFYAGKEASQTACGGRDGKGSSMRQTLRTIAIIFIPAVIINYPWELAHSQLYEGMSDFGLALWYCFVASLGDWLLVFLIFGAGCAVFRRSDWFVSPEQRGYFVNVGLTPVTQMLAHPPLISRAVTLLPIYGSKSC
jgi:hypothetical protein